MRRLLVVLVLLAVPVLSSCGDDSGDDGGGSSLTADDLDGRTFESTSLTGRELVEDSAVTLTFDDGNLSFQAGCNSMSADYEVSDGRLELTSEPAGTLMACPDELQTQDEWLADFLGGGVDATLSGADLTLTGEDETLELTAQP